MHWRKSGGLRSWVLLAAACLLPAAGAAEEAAPPPSSYSPPRLEAALLDGTPFALSAPRAAVTVLVLWSPESLASRKSMGELQRFHAASANRDIYTVAVSTLADAGRVRSYVAEHGFGFPVALLGDHNLGLLSNLPLLYIVDGDGKVRGIHAGLFRLRDLEQGVAAVLP